MVQRGLESGPGAQRMRFLGVARQNEAVSQGVRRSKSGFLDLSGVPGIKGEKKPFKDLNDGKTFL